MAITTLASHVNRAVSFYNNTSVYFCIGKSSTWVDDNNPPAPDPLATSVLEIIGYRQADTVQLVIQDNVNGTITYQGQKWSVVTTANAQSSGAKWVYVSTTIADTDLPLGYYRQVGVYTGLTKANGVGAGVKALTPAQVQTAGSLEVLDNRQPSNRLSNQRETISVIIEF